MACVLCRHPRRRTPWWWIHFTAQGMGTARCCDECRDRLRRRRWTGMRTPRPMPR